MVELEKRPVEPLTFTYRNTTASAPVQQDYTASDVMNTLDLLGIKKQSKAIYTELVSCSTTPTQPDLRIRHVITQDDFTRIIQHFIQMQESAKRPNIRSFLIADETTIKLSGISDYKWTIYGPLLNALSTTRNQTESGEIQITPLAYKIVKSFFPENASENSMFYAAFQELNKALSPNGWSIIREGQGPKKPISAPWFLRGPDDNGVQNTGISKVPEQENIYDSASAFTKEKKRALERSVEEFDRIAFGTSLLHLCLSNLTNFTDPEVKAIFTKDPAQAMSVIPLPPGLKLQDVIGEKTPQEYFQESIKATVNSMAGKNYQQLSVKQQTIIELWKELRKQSGQRPEMVIFEHFSGPNSNEPLNETSNDNGSDG